jgi:hypothetical protein
VTIDLRREHYDRLHAMAEGKDIPVSTMARSLLVPSLSGEGVE